MNKKQIEEIAKLFKKKRLQLKLTQQHVADKSGVSRSMYSQLENGHTENPRNIAEISEALKISKESLHGLVLVEYTLDNAPVCSSQYHLFLDTALQLGLPGLTASESVTCLVVPWDQESQEQAIRGLFRKNDHTRAVVVEFLRLGDDLETVPANAPHLSDTLQHGVSGHILGAIRDIVSAESLFYR